MEAECVSVEGPFSLRVFDDGVSIWDNSRQFQLERGEIQRLLRPFQRLGFGAMDESYGGKADPRPATPRAAIRVTCRISLTIDGRTKEVVQQAGGRQSPSLKELAQEVYMLGGEAARRGVGASSLEDGLRKVAQGQLAPQTFFVTMQRKPTTASPSSEGAWLLRVHGATVSTRHFVPGEGYRGPLSRQLSEAEIRELAFHLAAQDVDSLPLNLWADVYTDLSLRVLNQSKRIQARPFAGITPETYGETQQRFDRICATLVKLHSTTVAAH